MRTEHTIESNHIIQSRWSSHSCLAKLRSLQQDPKAGATKYALEGPNMKERAK